MHEVLSDGLCSLSCFSWHRKLKHAPFFPHTLCLVHKIYMKTSWDNKYLHALLILKRKFLN